jgi:hypothetical protein
MIVNDCTSGTIIGERKQFGTSIGNRRAREETSIKRMQ